MEKGYLNLCSLSTQFEKKKKKRRKSKQMNNAEHLMSNTSVFFKVNYRLRHT